jgi:hypothetical protein
LTHSLAAGAFWREKIASDLRLRGTLCARFSPRILSWKIFFEMPLKMFW